MTQTEVSPMAVSQRAMNRKVTSQREVNPMAMTRKEVSPMATIQRAMNQMEDNPLAMSQTAMTRKEVNQKVTIQKEANPKAMIRMAGTRRRKPLHSTTLHSVDRSARYKLDVGHGAN